MSMTLEIKPEKEVLLVRVTGEFALDEANDCFTRMLQAIAQHEVTKVLVDCRDLTGKISTLDRFEHGEYAAQELSRAYDAGLSRAIRFAYVCLPPVLDHERFGETVARNRGVNADVTDSVVAARQWLESA